MQTRWWAVILSGVMVWIGAGCVEDDDESAPLPTPGDVEQREFRPLSADEVGPITGVSGPVDGASQAADADRPEVDDAPVLEGLDCPQGRLAWGGDRDWPLDEDTQLCGATWADWMIVAPRGDAWILLAREYISTRLNLAGGVEGSESINRVVVEARSVLERCQSLVQASRLERRRAAELAGELAQFNEALCTPEQGLDSASPR